MEADDINYEILNMELSDYDSTISLLSEASSNYSDDEEEYVFEEEHINNLILPVMLFLFEEELIFLPFPHLSF